MSEYSGILVEGDGKIYLIKVRDRSGKVYEVWPVRDILPLDKETGMYVFENKQGRYYIDSDDVEIISPK